MITSIFAWLLSLFKNSRFTGVLPDTRLDSEKEKDWLHEERAVEAPVNPFGNGITTESPYPYENQKGTSSCVPHGVGLALAIERKNDTNFYVRLAYIFAYRLRSVFPKEGSVFSDIFDIYRMKGAPLFQSLPTPEYEKEANKLVLTAQEYTEAEIFKGKQWWTIQNSSNIETLAGVAQQGHGVPILIFATEEEYSRQYPSILNPNLTSFQAEVRHCVCILPYSGFTKDGKKYVAIQDSAWFGGWKLRYLSEDFLYKRCFAAGYWDTVAVLGTGKPPQYNFTHILKYGSSGEEVKQMQNLLISEGLLPNNCNTGYFGGRTLAAVNAFQTKYANDILIPNNLTAPTGIWGNSCISKANSLVHNSKQ